MRFRLPDVGSTTTAAAGVGALGFAVIGILAFDDGGYWPSAWAWLALAAWWLVAVGLALKGPVEVSTAGAVFAGAAIALFGWTALSTTWSESVGRSVFEAERTGAYAGVAAALVLFLRPHGKAMLVGAWLATTAVATYAVATRVFPERLGVYDPEAGYRLAEPLGYSNALGILCALGVIIAVHRAAFGSGVSRAAAGASLVWLLVAIYFTFSRGAWAAMALGLVVAAIVEPRRLRLLAAGASLLAAPAATIAVAASSKALVNQSARLELASAQGHRLALVVVLAAGVNAAWAWWLTRLRFPSRTPRRLRRIIWAGATALIVVVIACSVTFAGRAVSAFAKPARADATLNERLFTFSGSDRGAQWRVAWNAFTSQPLTGTGAGTYELHWMRERPLRMKVRDAHNLYVETLGELGLVGLALLALLLGAPFLALRRLDRAAAGAIAAPAAGVWTAFIAHACLDWDWEMPAVSVTALVAAGGLAAVGGNRVRVNGNLRLAVNGCAAVAAVLAVVAVAGNSPLRGANDAAARGDWLQAERAARRAERWLPWSSDALQIQADAQLATGRSLEAASNFRRAIARDPDDWELWDGLARAARGSERAAAAVRARRLNPLR